jgi:transcription factor 1
MQKFYASQTGVKGAIDAITGKKIKGLRMNYDPKIYDQIFDKLQLKEQYLTPEGNPTGRLNIIDYNVRLSPMTYYMNQTLKPQHHLIYPDGQAAHKFWKQMSVTDTEMINMHVIESKITTTVKANLLTKPLANNLIDPAYLPQLNEVENAKFKREKKEPVNPTLLFVGDFISSTNAGALRTCIYYNEVNTSMFRYGGVKFVAWTKPNEVLKYLGPLGSIHRRTNAMMANLYADLKIIACSETFKNPKATKLLGDLDFVALPYSEHEGEICLVEIQSNHNKFNIKFQDELHLIIHKLFCTPGATLREKLHVLGPGAEDYLTMQIPAELLEKKISMITETEFILLSEAYYYWPFKPNTSLETYANQESFFDTE